jgi:hypothetical protein
MVPFAMRPLLVLPPALGVILFGACATPTVIDLSVGSEVGCDAGATVVLVGGTSLGALASNAPSTVSSRCAPGAAGEAEMGNVVVLPAASKSEAVAFAVMTRADGQPPDGCLDVAQASQCIVAKRELRFLPHTELAMRIDLRLSCLGVVCPSDETCVKGVCLGAQVPPGSCTGACDEGSLVAADAGASYPIGGALSGLAPGDTVVLQDNGGDLLTLTANGPFVFATPLAAGSAYAVTIQSSPTSPTAQTCAVMAGSGTVGTEGVATVQVRCDSNGTVTLATQQGADYLAVDSANVYWTNYNDGSVMRAPVGGGTATTLASGQKFTLAITVDATRVFWTNTGNPTGSVAEALIDGSQTTTLASGQGGPSSLAVDATSLYWTNQGGGTLVKTPKGGGGTATTLATGQGLPYGVVVDGASVYWTTEQEGRVKKVPVGGGATVTLASGQDKAMGLALDATSLYWTNQVSPGAIVKLPLGGGVPTTLAVGQAAPGAVVVDATTVYWANSDGSIASVPVGGGAVTTLVSGQQQIDGIAVDATSLYWADYGRGAVMRRTPK